MPNKNPGKRNEHQDKEHLFVDEISSIGMSLRPSGSSSSGELINFSALFLILNMNKIKLHYYFQICSFSDYFLAKNSKCPLMNFFIFIQHPTQYKL